VEVILRSVEQMHGSFLDLHDTDAARQVLDQRLQFHFCFIELGLEPLDVGNIRQRNLSDELAVLILPLFAEAEYIGHAAVLALEPVLQIRRILHCQNGAQLLGVDREILLDEQILKAKLLLFHILQGVAGNGVKPGVCKNDPIMLQHVYQQRTIIDSGNNVTFSQSVPPPSVK